MPHHSLIPAFSLSQRGLSAHSRRAFLSLLLASDPLSLPGLNNTTFILSLAVLVIIFLPFSELLLLMSLAGPHIFFLPLQVNFLVCMFASELNNKPLVSLTMPCTEWAFNPWFLIRLYIHYITAQLVSLSYIST